MKKLALITGAASGIGREFLDDIFIQLAILGEGKIHRESKHQDQSPRDVA